jgi:hypothetical protein
VKEESKITCHRLLPPRPDRHDVTTPEGKERKEDIDAALILPWGNAVERIREGPNDHKLSEERMNYKHQEPFTLKVSCYLTSYIYRRMNKSSAL